MMFRKKWKNYVGNQSTVPLQTFYPTSLEKVVEIVKDAQKQNVTVRAVGSGHSFSDVALTDGFLIMPNKLNKVFTPLDTSLFKDGTDTSHLFHFESGATLRKLNKVLDKIGFAFANLGGFDAQTFVGAMATSTHGSGITLGPLPDMCASIETVSDDGILYRVEPSGGITDPAKYEAQYPPDAAGKRERILKQDDQWFNAVKAGMGCMGIIYSVIINVVERYWLTEKRIGSDWEAVKKDLKEGKVFTENRHYEFVLNPYKVEGKHYCLVTTRNYPDKPTTSRRNRNGIIEFLVSIPLVRTLTSFFLRWQYRKTGKLLEDSLKGLAGKTFTSISYKVFNIGKANYVPVYSMEVNFPMEKDGNKFHYIDGIERFLQLVREDEKIGQLFINGPVGVRFVKKSDALLSPQYIGNTCTVEIPSVKGTKGAFQMFARFEDDLYQLYSRPHWGQVNTLTGSHNFIASMYPEYNKWIEVYKELNTKGTFDNGFSKRVGFKKEDFGTP
ncbi:MAG: FAD-binding protein [bacterium]|nr:FAD-binding protein [bacterium]